MEEDYAKAGMERSEMTDLRSVYRWVGMTLFAAVLALTISVICDIRVLNSPASWAIGWYCTGLVILPMLILSFSYCAIQISRDQECFAKYPPRLPNLLAILTGEEKAPKGFRNKINFWGDLIGVGLLWVLACAMLSADLLQVFDRNELFGASFVFWLLLSLIILIYFLFALFFAGIPRRWYWGMIFLGVSIFVIFFGVNVMIPGTSIIKYCTSNVPVSLMIVVPFASYLLCFVFLGTAGLWVFRKKESGGRNVSDN